MYWSYDIDGNTAIGGGNLVEGNQIFYANFVQKIEMTIDTDGANFITSPEVIGYTGLFIVGRTFYSDVKFRAPETIFEKTGYTFGGYYYDAAYTLPIDTTEDGDVITAELTIVYQKWTQN